MVKINIFTSKAGLISQYGMEISGHNGAGAGAARKPVYDHDQDITRVVTQVISVEAARALPLGSIVGDPHGGLTFTDAVASVLESRSACGWQEVEREPGSYWTVIIVNR